ncbi:acetyl-CoA carboxylase, carboxyltransferase subunit beta [Actomonas aquatica]|uniref:Acetyl-coenzyme A carboxylase carboxyl transferase subunit beta n=1 Tax=Actomonas aquatica TaxID=2866162 RepID=A0ABZ1CAB1_9BACT|nr:acetyl-CoA carboxylase, carboxyltransferase subunit beta [Opitutus sp. WL0086]WRQ88616.1 acetyl-CoA carboxylase, carboxyltransferase subunit beta [Opitutus sp. WL0086]
MSLFSKPKYSTVVPKKKDIPKGLWTKCPISGEIVFNKELEANQMVVPKSGYHFPIGARQRLEGLLDPGSFVETDAGVTSADPLEFVDSKPYPERIAKYKEVSGLPEAVISGTGNIHSIPVSVAVMDFRFCGGAMGSAAGEKITRAIERALEQKTPCIIFSASGGARMQEGIFSLMQMAKTSAALGRLSEAKLPFVSVLTHPTMGGVTASFAVLGDINIAEPGALIGFAGARVIKETTKQTLPPGFQTAEFLLQKGLIDQIVSRLDLRDRLRDLLSALYVKKATAPRPAAASAAAAKPATAAESPSPVAAS